MALFVHAFKMKIVLVQWELEELLHDSPCIAMEWSIPIGDTTTQTSYQPLVSIVMIYSVVFNLLLLSALEVKIHLIMYNET